MADPLVSILIPSHNSARWLAATLASALAQTHPRCEIIVIDDGSTDDSAAIAEGFVSRGVRVIRQPNGGAAAARNTALRHAHGDFLQFLDADDLLSPDKIARQLAALAAAPAGTLASGPWGKFATDPSAAVFQPEPVWADHTPIDWLVQSWCGGGMFPPLVWLVPRAVADAAGPWNEHLSLDDDGEYFTRVLLHSSGVRFVPEARSFYRTHDGPRVSASRGRAAAISSFTSIELKERHLLTAEDSPRTKRALGHHWQRFVWEQCATAPDLAARAFSRVRVLAPDLPRPEGPFAYRLAATAFGWRRARRLQLAAHKLLHR
jgi:glycosyltransferase involved in cell wall biosynthesis